MTKARSNPPGGLLATGDPVASKPPVLRRPALAPLYALGIAFVLVLILGTIVQRVSHRPSPPPPPPPTPPMLVIRVTVEGQPAAVSPEKDQNFRIQIMAKNANPGDAPYKEWPLPIPSITLVQENLVDQLVCLNGPSGWKVIQHSIPVEDIPNPNGSRCTTALVADRQSEEISFTVSKN
ncbi:MAG: hypothetical protein JO115_15030 [Pseudonocardiales bacterium]|nr:hypothetical protein [Pseudonocardiales bacterium]